MLDKEDKLLRIEFVAISAISFITLLYVFKKIGPYLIDNYGPGWAIAIVIISNGILILINKWYLNMRISQITYRQFFIKCYREVIEHYTRCLDMIKLNEDIDMMIIPELVYAISKHDTLIKIYSNGNSKELFDVYVTTSRELVLIQDYKSIAKLINSLVQLLQETKFHPKKINR